MHVSMIHNVMRIWIQILLVEMCNIIYLVWQLCQGCALKQQQHPQQSKRCHPGLRLQDWHAPHTHTYTPTTRTHKYILYITYVLTYVHTCAYIYKTSSHLTPLQMFLCFLWFIFCLMCISNNINAILFNYCYWLFHILYIVQDRVTLPELKSPYRLMYTTIIMHIYLIFGVSCIWWKFWCVHM